ncbi:MAG: hypothetical protein J5756_06575 [Clostridia bacterium]|nr:hypothetical protein [Clostridia bacterium]
MKKVYAIVSIALIAVLMLGVLTACGGAKDAIAGTWKQTDEVNGDWVWEFDGSGKCKLDGITTGFKTEGTYVLDEAAKTLTVTMDGWDDVKVYTYTLTDTTLDLESTYSSYNLVKQ